VIDKIVSKLNISPAQSRISPIPEFDYIKWLASAGCSRKPTSTACRKQGVPPEVLMASLFDAIVLQNLTVLTRGNTLLPQVLLLGRPKCLYVECARPGCTHRAALEGTASRVGSWNTAQKT